MTEQPSICKELITEGWLFRWNAESSRIDAIHEDGTELPLVVVLPAVDSVDRYEIGEAIAKLLSGEGSKSA